MERETDKHDKHCILVNM